MSIKKSRGPYWKQAALEAGITEQDISALIETDPVSRARKLIGMFRRTSDDRRRRQVIVLLHHLGDDVISGNFYADVLQDKSQTSLVKFWVTVWAGLSKFHDHDRVQRARAKYLNGAHPVDLLFSQLFPDGPVCRTKDNLDRSIRFHRPISKRPGSPRSEARILTFARPPLASIKRKDLD